MASQDVQQLRGYISQIDAATTKAGLAVTAIGARFQRLLDKIAAAPTLAEVEELVAQAAPLASSMTALEESLTAMGHDPADPVPVPVPEPPPVEPVA